MLTLKNSVKPRDFRISEVEGAQSINMNMRTPRLKVGDKLTWDTIGLSETNGTKWLHVMCNVEKAGKKKLSISAFYNSWSFDKTPVENNLEEFIHNNAEKTFTVKEVFEEETSYGKTTHYRWSV